MLQPMLASIPDDVQPNCLVVEVAYSRALTSTVKSEHFTFEKNQILMVVIVEVTIPDFWD
jgi:hypothetical protein